MEPVSILTVKAKLPLYKGEELATRVELIQLEEVGFEIVSQKDLYEVGDKAVYIQPDYNLSDLPIFLDFIAPKGSTSNSLLGKVDGIPKRIRARKFNLHRGDGVVIYSNGILLPISEVKEEIGDIVFSCDLTKELGITKYEEPEPSSNMKQSTGLKFPSFLYRTDETNINMLYGHIENQLTYPIILIGTQKIDGSSITIGVTDEFPEGFICSRNMRIPFTYKKVTGRRNKTLLEKLMFWTNPDLRIVEEFNNESIFLQIGRPYLNALLAKGKNNVVLRGELNGSGCKGSGNKLNPSKGEANNIKFFNIDTKECDGQYRKLPYYSYTAFCREFNFQTVPFIFEKTFNSKQEIIDTCEAYFKDHLIEGIVLRTPDSKFSTKYMNNYYDSKK